MTFQFRVCAYGDDHVKLRVNVGETKDALRHVGGMTLTKKAWRELIATLNAGLFQPLGDHNMTSLSVVSDDEGGSIG